MSNSIGPLVGRHILVVEDDYMVVQEMVRLLRQAGADIVGPYPDVEGALAALEAQPLTIAAATLDVVLRGGERVYPVAERLDELGIPFLFATGSSPGAENTAYADRPTLAKPITGRVLIKTLGRLLNGD